jgi:hypothetical protein
MHCVLVGESEGKRPIERPIIDGKITSEWILGKYGWKTVDWIHMAQVRDQWRALVNRIMKLGVQKRQEIS